MAKKKIFKKSSEKKVEEVKPEPVKPVAPAPSKDLKYYAKIDISRKYRQGDLVPDVQVKDWQTRGLNIAEMVEKR